MKILMTINYLIMILGGIWIYLVVYGVIDPFKGDIEKKIIWHKKFDKINKICAPIMIAAGVLLLTTEFLIL